MLKLPTHSGFHDLFLKYIYFSFNIQKTKLHIYKELVYYSHIVPLTVNPDSIKGPGGSMS